MKVFHSINDIDFNPNTILTVGTFDGVHRGHQLILNKLQSEAKKSDLRDLVITIHPHPQVVLQREDREPIRLLTSIEERIELFQKFGLSNLLILPFTLEFAQTPPDVFIKDLLFSKVGFSKMLIGYDHMFGKNRSGNFDLLNQLSSSLGFSIEKMDAFTEKDLVISSTKIRHALTDNNIIKANTMLGYNYFVKGVVVRGDMRGRTIGYPTANVAFKDQTKLLPGNGVYIVKVEIPAGNFYGMCNIGTRPTFKDNSITSFEVFIFDFDADIYDQDIKVEFLDFVRKEIKFDSVPKLIEAIKQDEIFCKEKINSF